MRIHLIVAVAKNGVIGCDGELPWRLPADLAYFKRMTSGHCVIMGRKTYQSIGRPLPKRTNIVVSRDPDFEATGCQVVTGVASALRLAESLEEQDVFVIGGAAIYALALPHADSVHLTRVEAEVKGDVYFPELDEGEWEVVSREPREADEKNEYAMVFTSSKRRQTAGPEPG